MGITLGQKYRWHANLDCTLHGIAAQHGFFHTSSTRHIIFRVSLVILVVSFINTVLLVRHTYSKIVYIVSGSAEILLSAGKM